jgi:hypothetical protein
MCHQLGLGLGNLWKSCDEYLRNALMVLLARAPQERLIGGILDQGMLEDIRGLGWQPWGVATFASGCLCQSPLGHGGDGSNRHWQP